MDGLAAKVISVVENNVDLSVHQRMVLALSGGLDSVVLLHILVHFLGDLSIDLRAVHVNHQISPNALQWVRFCRDLCNRLHIKLIVSKVNVATGNSLEGAARQARYAVFAKIRPDVLFLAHHRDDQAETVMLQLLRGSGPRGLSAMPLTGAMVDRKKTDPTQLIRPLLNSSRAEIVEYAERHQLSWIEDESNRDESYLRNFLRHSILPLIKDKLPQVDITLARAAQLQAETSELLDILAVEDLQNINEGLASSSLSILGLGELGSLRARNVLRYFLRAHQVLMPDHAYLDEILQQVLTARPDAQLRLKLQGYELRRYQYRLYIVPTIPVLDRFFACNWNGQSRLTIPQLGGTLLSRRQKGRGISGLLINTDKLRVCLRSGGEKLRPERGGHLRSVKNILQESKLPPWERERLPFIYASDRLVAIANLAIDVDFQVNKDEFGWYPIWQVFSI